MKLQIDQTLIIPKIIPKTKNALCIERYRARSLLLITNLLTY